MPATAEPGTAIARCHCGAVEAVASFPSRFCAHCYCWSCRTSHAAGVVTWVGFKRSQARFAKGEELLRAIFVTPVDREPALNSFPEERPDWAPFHALADD